LKTKYYSPLSSVDDRTWYLFLRGPGAGKAASIWSDPVIYKEAGAQQVLINRACSLEWTNCQIKELVTVWRTKHGLDTGPGWESFLEAVYLPLGRFCTKKRIAERQQQREAKTAKKTRHRVRQLLSNVGPLHLSEIADRLKIGLAAIKKECQRGCKPDGYLERVGRGIYRLRTAPAAPAKDPVIEDETSVEDSRTDEELLQEIARLQKLGRKGAFENRERRDEYEAEAKLPRGFDFWPEDAKAVYLACYPRPKPPRYVKSTAYFLEAADLEQELYDRRVARGEVIPSSSSTDPDTFPF
jgi:hypothetical protein